MKVYDMPKKRQHGDSTTGTPFRTQTLFGLPFLDAPSERVVAEHLAGWPGTATSGGSHRSPLVVTPNVDIVVQLHNRSAVEMLESTRNASFVLPDGWPIVGVSRLVGRPLSARIAGSSVFAHWWPIVSRQQRRIAMLVSNETVRERLASEHPDALVVIPPMISTDPVEIEAVAGEFVAKAAAMQAEFLVFGIGLPKDLLLAKSCQAQWPDDVDPPMMFCLGASAELYVGLRRRAPRWVQRIGMEWMMRFLQEPRRLFQRYFVRDLRFIPLAAKEISRRRSS